MTRDTENTQQRNGALGTHSTETETDVVVVGAGPTGLLLAGDLAEAGHSVVLVERRGEEVSNLSRSLVVHARTLEQLDSRPSPGGGPSLADELVADGHVIDRLRLFGLAALEAGQLPSRYPFVLFTPQYEVERVLKRRASALGVTFRHHTRLTGLTQDADGVVALLDDEKSGPARVRSAYLVGTDGVRSTVREALGLPFPGKSVVRSLVLADVRLSSPPPEPFTVSAVNDGFALLAAFGGGRYRVTGWNRHRQADSGTPVPLEEVRELLRLCLGSDYGLYEASWTSRFHSDERQAPSYRHGRVFLAGDAAHVHSPAGAMGMNTGLQDAANLSWKLSAALQGRADERLLDSYETERHRVGRLVLRVSGAIIRVALLHGRAGRTARSVGARLLNGLGPLKRRAALTITGVGLSYGRERGSHPLTGRRAPDLALDSGRLQEALRGGRFVLVTPQDAALPPAVRAAREQHLCRVAHWTSGSPRRTTLLVRPDGYIAWAADAPHPASAQGAVARWTGVAPDAAPSPLPEEISGGKRRLIGRRTGSG
ncbi:FAD-dependent monooxygenase [Streptomyces sp. HNM0574]|uniref:FAD-dependent monooxygenase n=1 Tax=Streptomyces sp. HNM0574 TaxID=2714954 RepID=UPI00146F58A1|nr:FAD-dependent monooxygenase [Streptomyces sp. HNM0574]NLU70255.1 FAD-binding protein [Streptomyces sp. HNM0574]